MKRSVAITGAAFLMATSAIGPGFITQTSVFTQSLLASFGFVILISVVLDVVAQLNIWRIITVSGKHAQVLANETFKGMGHLLTFFIVIGGLVFNIGNIAGCGLGLQILMGLDASNEYPVIGAWLSALIALVLFWVKDAGRAMDLLVRALGMVMIGLMVWTVWHAKPPYGMALYRTFYPAEIDVKAILTLVGGTVGGYISFAGAHRLLDAHIKGKEHLSKVTYGSIRAILITALMRALLFLATLGVIVNGGILDPHNPAASVFELSGGQTGRIIFGIILWCAAITSVIGSAYTSVSFLRSLYTPNERMEKWITTFFILISTLVFSFFGKPVQLLVFAGAFNGFILPLSLAIILLSARKFTHQYQYTHPNILIWSGWLVVLVMGWMGMHLLWQQLRPALF